MNPVERTVCPMGLDGPMSVALGDAIAKARLPITVTERPEAAWALVIGAPIDFAVLTRLIRSRKEAPFVLLLAREEDAAHSGRSLLVQQDMPANTTLIALNQNAPSEIRTWFDRCIQRTESKQIVESAARMLQASQAAPPVTPPPIHRARPARQPPTDIPTFEANETHNDGDDAITRWHAAMGTGDAPARLLRALEERAKIGHWFMDAAEKRFAWSPRTPTLLGLPAEATGDLETLLMVTHPADRMQVRDAFEQALAGTPPAFRHRTIGPDGQTIVIEVRGQAELDRSGRLVRMAGTMQDVTEQHLAEQQARWMMENAIELDRLSSIQEFKERFLQTIAHELNTPLTPIRLQMHIARGAASQITDPTLARSLRVVERNVDRLRDLVDEMLDSVRIQDGRLPLRPVRVDAAKLVREAIEAVEDVAANHGLTMQYKQDPAQFHSALDARRISQVIDNLLSNAIKYSPGGGTITVRLARNPGSLTLTVQDEGIGLSPEGQKALFEPFSRVHDQSTVRAEGTGLGLYICKGIVEAHAGSIEASSDGLGHGATLTVKLPIRQPTPEREGTRPARTGDD